VHEIDVRDAGSDWHDPLPTLYSAPAICHSAGQTSREHIGQIVALAGDMNWDGEHIDHSGRLSRRVGEWKQKRLLAGRSLACERAGSSCVNVGSFAAACKLHRFGT
jgi:hypothetical protein